MTTIEYMLGILMTIFIITSNMYVISPIKFNKIEFFGLMLVAGLISITLLILLGFSQYLIGVILTILIVLLSYYKSKNIVVILINTTFPIGTVLISNYLTINFIYLFDVNIYKKISDFKNYIFFSIILFIFSLGLSYLLDYMLNKKLNIKEIILKKDQIFLMSTFSIISFVMIYFNIFFGTDYYDSPILRITSLVLLLSEFSLTIYTMFYFLKTIRMEEESKRKEEMIEQMNTYTREMETLYNSIKSFKHDYKNMLVTMATMIEENKIDELKDFFYNKICPYSKNMLNDTLQIGDLANIDIAQIKGLIASKAVIAQEEKPPVNFNVEVIGRISEINMDIIDLCRVLGIIMDNAIEAARVCEVPNVTIAMFKASNAIVIIVKNNYAGELPNIDQLYGKGYSSKGKDRGLGLTNLKKILDSYNNIYLDLSKPDEEFCITLKIFFKEGDVESA